MAEAGTFLALSAAALTLTAVDQATHRLTPPTLGNVRGVVSIVALSDRADLMDALWAMESPWPSFMNHDPIANRLFGLVPEMFPEHQLLALDDGGAVIGRVIAVPFAWDGELEGLPQRGWDAILELGISRPAPPTAVSLLEARVVSGHQRRGLSAELLGAARRNVRRMGLSDLFGPVRPTAKSDEPNAAMAEYAARVRDDGLPVDPWLRTHVRLGGVIVKVCPLSMVVPGTLAQWREWTGLAFADSGVVEVPGGLTPVHVSIEHDHAVYVEPNVWVHHRLAS
ncbi:MAG: N-acetyltransferase [Solirubrobacteraceae bacterium]